MPTNKSMELAREIADKWFGKNIGSFNSMGNCEVSMSDLTELELAIAEALDDCESCSQFASVSVITTKALIQAQDTHDDLLKGLDAEKVISAMMVHALEFYAIRDRCFGPEISPAKQALAEYKAAIKETK